MNGHQNVMFSHLIGALKSPRNLNGYGADYALEKAKSGDADAQTLVGCCYGHNGMMATDVVVHNVDEALKWWHLAAEQGHKYAMREIALYHWHRGEQEEAKKWNEKGDLKIFIISRHSMDYLQSIDTDKEAEDKGQ